MSPLNHDRERWRADIFPPPGTISSPLVRGAVAPGVVAGARPGPVMYKAGAGVVLPADQKNRARAYRMHIVPARPCARRALTPVPGGPVLEQSDPADDSPADDSTADDSPADDSPADGTSGGPPLLSVAPPGSTGPGCVSTGRRHHVKGDGARAGSAGAPVEQYADRYPPGPARGGAGRAGPTSTRWGAQGEGVVRLARRVLARDIAHPRPAPGLVAGDPHTHLARRHLAAPPGAAQSPKRSARVPFETSYRRPRAGTKPGR